MLTVDYKVDLEACFGQRCQCLQGVDFCKFYGWITVDATSIIAFNNELFDDFVNLYSFVNDFLSYGGGMPVQPR